MRPLPLTNQHCNTGENPYWHPDDQCVYWTDIPAGVLYRYDTHSGQTSVCYRGEPVGGFTLQADGKFLLFRVTDVATFDPRLGHVQPIARYTDDTMARFNDVHADPLGRVYAGTIGKDWKPVGGLYLVELDGSVRKVVTGSACSNGMAFSPDESTLYWHCSSRKKIYAFDYDRPSGELRNERLFYDAPGDEGTPDGTAMDRDGNLWSCRWDGSRIVIISPRGQKLDEVRFPVAKVSCAIFGGEKDDELFVTTAGGKPESQTEDGTLYKLTTATTGRRRFCSRIGL